VNMKLSTHSQRWCLTLPRNPLRRQRKDLSARSLSGSPPALFFALLPRSFGVELSGYLLIGQPTPYNPFHGCAETFRISRLPIVIAKRLFVQIAKKMEWLDAYIGSANAALQETPEVLKGVGMHRAVHIGYSVAEVRKHVEAGSALYSDALQSYNGLAGEWTKRSSAARRGTCTSQSDCAGSLGPAGKTRPPLWESWSVAERSVLRLFLTAKRARFG
jgi:hypothetical protein